MSREAHAGICERRGVRFPPATQLGNFKAVGRERTRTGQPVKVTTHDFPSHAVGKAVPYGVLDIALDEGYVSVGVSADTAQFAAASILARWEQLGAERYPHATTLTITRGLRRFQQRPREALEDRDAAPGGPHRP